MLNPNHLIYKNLNESLEMKRQFVLKHEDSLWRTAEAMWKAIFQGNKILVCGNGGSASDSLHFAGEMIGRLKIERGALPAIALTADVSVLTAVGNDYGFDQIFARQVKALAKPGDVLLAISTSGNSRNVLLAAHEASGMGLYIVGLLGNDGGSVKPYCHIALLAGGSCASRIQETHIFAIHTIVDLIDNMLCEIKP